MTLNTEAGEVTYNLFTDGESTVLASEAMTVELYVSQPDPVALAAPEFVPETVPESSSAPREAADAPDQLDLLLGGELDNLLGGNTTIDLTDLGQLVATSETVAVADSGNTLDLRLDDVIAFAEQSDLSAVLGTEKLHLAIDGEIGDQVRIDGTNLSHGLPAGVVKADEPSDLYGNGELYYRYFDADQGIELFIHQNLIDF